MDSSGHNAVLIKKGITGYIIYGQYREYPAGRYKASYRMKFLEEDGNRSIGRLDVSVEKGRKVLATKDFYASDFERGNIYNISSIEFDLPKKEKDIEFRVYSSGEMDFMVDTIEIGVSL